ncbi:hypothetical protein [Glaciecola sp. SC05]|uniref:hypothetical protein n=1 Tax=Glaciecola sp. SC05 TaxID=1987355 RepID=UPI0035286FE3
MSEDRPYFIACHDAGAANIIMSQELAEGFEAAFYCLEGPACKKWLPLVPSNKVCSDIHYAISKCKMLRSGTGWASDFEHNARNMALNAGLHVTAVVDHWVNYEQRFIRHGEKVLPNAIEVMDTYAKALAEKTFPDIPVELKHNFYLDMTAHKARSAVIERTNDILYVLEPVPEDWGCEHEIAEEFQALNYFSEFIKYRFNKPYDQIRLRLHPSETIQKYAIWAQQNQDLNVVFDHYDDIETSIANAKWVFGCESYGLIVALHCDKQVYSTIPHWAPLARLPHSKLRQLRDFMPIETN